MKRLLFLLLIPIVLSACSDEFERVEYFSTLPDEIYGTIEDCQTRTSMDAFGNIRWMEGDEISFFFTNTINSRYVLKTGAGSTSASFKKIPPTEPVAGSAIPFNVAYYPYQEDIELERNETSAILSVYLPETQTYASGSPGNGANPMVTITENTEDMELAFKNVNSMLKLQLKGDATIKKIEFSGNNDEILCGSAQVTATYGSTPTIALTGEGKTVTLDCGDGVKLNETTPTAFCISLPPLTLTKGFTVKIYDSVGKYMEKSSTKSNTFNRSMILSMPAFNYVPTGEVATDEGSGIYLGIIGFNQNLSNYPIKFLSTNSKQGYFDFIDGLSNNYDGTAIYYAVDQAITTLQEGVFPEDLNSVNVITFTDGIDNYSLDIYDEIEFGKYNTPDECGEYVNSRITSEQVAGNNITGYAVGSRHSDVNSSRFTSTLNRIASSSSLVYELSNMSSVEAKFKEIAKNITEINKTQNITVSIAGGLGNDERVRFTFDLAANYSTPTGSSLYIEGTFQRTSATTRKLTNITCGGLTMKETEVVGTKNSSTGLFDFKFEDVATNNKSLIDSSKTLEWWGNPWQKDTEFNPDANTQTEVISHSAAIILVLDCTKSLGDKFADMKTSAKSFINTMLPNIVPSQTSLTFSSNSESKTVSITADCEWTTTSSADWLSVSVSGNSLSVTAAENTSLSSRSATITLCKSGENISVANIEISQAGAKPSIVPASSSLSFSTESESKDVAVTSNCEWTATSSADWLTVVRIENTLVLSVSSNDSDISRTATITLFETNSGEAIATIKATQALSDNFSTTPKDLFLAVVKNGVRYYVSQEAYNQYVKNKSQYLIEGVCIIAGSESFIIDMKDFSYYEMRRAAAKLMFPDNLPTYSQGIVISSRFAEINNALYSFDGECLSSSRYHTSYNLGDTYYFIRGSGGSLDNGCTSLMPGLLRCVRPTIGDTKEETNDLKLKIANGTDSTYLSREEFETTGIPTGYSVVGVAVITPGISEFAIELTDKTQDSILRSAAKQMYKDFVPTYNEGLVISARMFEINDAILAFGGTPMSYSYHYHTTANSGETYYFINGSGGYLDDGHTSYQEGYVRGVIR